MLVIDVLEKKGERVAQLPIYRIYASISYLLGSRRVQLRLTEETKNHLMGIITLRMALFEPDNALRHLFWGLLIVVSQKTKVAGANPKFGKGTCRKQQSQHLSVYTFPGSQWSYISDFPSLFEDQAGRNRMLELMLQDSWCSVPPTDFPSEHSGSLYWWPMAFCSEWQYWEGGNRAI